MRALSVAAGLCLLAGCGSTADSAADVAGSTTPPTGAANVEMDLDYGESFGECIGYCDTTISIDGTEVVLVAIANDGRDDRSSAATLDAGVELAAVVAALDPSSLESIYGCPDCTDGGATQLLIDGASFTWETGNPPEALAPFDRLLAPILQALRTCASTNEVTIADACIPVE